MLSPNARYRVRDVRGGAGRVGSVVDGGTGGCAMGGGGDGAVGDP
jgi:hypothetical protein